MRFEEAKRLRDQLEADVAEYSAALNRFPKGKMGLVPDSVRASREWQATNAAYQRAFRELRNFNESFVKQFRKELDAERRARRGQIPNQAGRFRRNAGSPDALFEEAWQSEMQSADPHGYNAVLLGCIAVLKGAGWPAITTLELADEYHDPLVSYASERHPTLNLIGRGLNEWWERAGRLGAPAERTYRSHTYDYERGPNFSYLQSQIDEQAKKLKIRRGTKRYAELLADVRPRAIQAAATLTRDLSEARSIRIDGEIAKVTREAAAKQERAARIERKAAIATTLIEAAGAGPTDAAILAMKELIERAEAAAQELQREAEYLESTKQGLDPEQTAAEWWERTYG